MITKEDFEKLINNGDRVYFIKNKEIYSIGLDKNWCFIDNEYLKWSSAVNKLLGNEYHLLDDLYKTKDEAEFALEFGNITRTETLDLPTWEEFTIDREMEEFGFFNKYTRYCCIEVISKNWFRDYLVVKENGMIVYGGKFDREHYIEACRIAKDLFLGKEPKGKENA